MTTTDYRNFDLLIARAGERYRAFVVDAPAGEASVVFDLPFAPDEITRLGSLVRGASRRPGAAEDAGPAANLADLGRRLFDAVFRDRVGALLTASLSSVAGEGAGLRLRLRFEEDAADLAILPWETLYDPAQAQFIGLGERSPILRYLSLPRSRSALLVEPPLRVLAVLSSPADLPPLNMEREWQAIQDALAGLTADGKFVLERLATPAWPRCRIGCSATRCISSTSSATACSTRPRRPAAWCLEDAPAGPTWCGASSWPPSCATIPPCAWPTSTPVQARWPPGSRSSPAWRRPWCGKGVPAAVAMQAEISDAGAVELARAFYAALAAGRPVDAALTQARVALSVAGSPEWAIPVLFSRSPDNRLFDIRQVLPTPDCPYPGMTPFSEAQKDLFFGRDKEIEDAVERLRQHPFLTVVGPSGSGKSSLIYAGVIPALRRSKRFGPGAWDIKIMRPGDSRTADGKAAPMQALAQLLNLSPQSPFPNPQFPTLLLVDQFEEIFTLAGADEAQAFLDALNGLIGRPNLHILLTVRADFYPELMACSLWQPIRANRLELTPLGDDELWAAIVEPAARVGVEVDEALAVKLIADASGQKGVLPLVQETLVLLWDKVKARRLKLEAYKEMGESGRSGLQVAIDRRATTVYHNLPDAAQPIARRIFLRLIQFGEGRADTRRQQTAAELRASGDDSALFDQTLAKLTESRLLTASGDAEGGERRVDIAHEALIAGWPRLQAW
ncbi:ATP-binding protein, partial [Candidatus Amarolinea dominans]|uniref:ATP-binding protein n=1 Tax=Candidatus Amarolinea dominans TaxID=3140696 RepID=UPI0031CC7D64